MKELLKSYAELILKGLKVEDKKYLYIEMPIYLEEFKSILAEEVKKYDLEEVYFDISDSFKKKELLLNNTLEEIIDSKVFDGSIRNKYAELDAAFLFIDSGIPEFFDGVDAHLFSEVKKYVRKTELKFRELYENNKLYWCIAGASNPYWAEKLGLTEEQLWAGILEVCMVKDNNDPYEEWLKKDIELKCISKMLNEYNFKYLKYTNAIGTDLTIELPKGHIWEGGSENGVFVNMPTYEVFTSPKYDGVNGIVYATKPLIYNNILINDFWIKFENGKAIDFDAKVGRDALKSIIEYDDASAFLGECALVSYDSPINNLNLLFKETLYDENASCHLALGMGFIQCVKDGNEEDYRSSGINFSKIHVDFMIGSEDMNIIGIDDNGNEITIMESGNIKKRV